MTSMEKVSKYCIENSEILANEIVESVINRMQLNLPTWEKEQAVSMYIEFLKFFGEILISKDSNAVPHSLIDWSKKNSEQVSSEGKISSIVVRYPPTREIITDIVTRISIEFGSSVEENAFMIKLCNSMLDLSLNETVFAFERLSEKHKAETQKELAQLSAPIVPVKDGVVVLPLIGIIDSYRATHITEETIPKIAELMIDYVIIDFSGVFTIDDEVVHYLQQIENTLSLMGIHVISTGLRPTLAKKTVNSGMRNPGIQSFANVKQALESISMA